MTNLIISKSELRERGILQKGKSYIVSNRGKKEFILLPFSSDIEELLEEYEILQNKEKLTTELKVSKKSGRSSLIV